MEKLVKYQKKTTTTSVKIRTLKDVVYGKEPKICISTAGQLATVFVRKM